MTDYLHIKFGLIWIKETKVTEGGGIRPPQVENVLNGPGEIGLKQKRGDVHRHKLQMFNGKLKGSLEYFFEDENFGGNLWNSHPYLVWENSKFETETSKLGGHAPSVLAVTPTIQLPSKVLIKN